MNDKEMETFIVLQDIKNLLEAALDKTMCVDDGRPRIHSLLVRNIVMSISNVNVMQHTYLDGDLQKQADIADQSADNDKTNKQ